MDRYNSGSIEMLPGGAHVDDVEVCECGKQFHVDSPDLHFIDGEYICTDCKKEAEIKQAFETIKQAMIDDEPSEGGSLAHVWHCAIKMMCYESIREASEETPPEQAYLIGSETARRFMKSFFDVETKG